MKPELKIFSKLLPETENSKARYGNTYLSMLDPSPDRVYIKILNVLKDGESRNIDQIFEVIPGSVKHRCSNGYFRWSSHSILGCLHHGGYVDFGKGKLYKITQKGIDYLNAVGM